MGGPRRAAIEEQFQSLSELGVEVDYLDG